LIFIRKINLLQNENKNPFFIQLENVLELFNVYFHFKNVLEQDYLIHGDHYGMVEKSFFFVVVIFINWIYNLALISLLKFLQNCESQLTKHRDLFQLASKVINIFNLFITFGDTFLRTPEAYDEVFYETVRCYHVFDNLFAFGKKKKIFLLYFNLKYLACRYANNDNEFKESALKLMVNLTNIK
jgi:hypothetical protein